MISLGYVVSRVLRKARGNAITGSVIDPTSKIESGSTIVRTRFDRHSFCGYDCTFIDCDVGAFCSIANRVTAGGARHPMEYVSTSPVFLAHRDSVKTKFSRHPYAWRVRTTIGHDVWIGENVLIKGGVNVGHGAVVGMGSVVTRDVPPYAIVAGNPAHLIRMRFGAEMIEALLKLEWWNLPDQELRRLAPQFTDPEVMLRQEGFL
ncbi:CatB-related O-acetyltransferase [Accumulibacter sp.]|uniref:CatB-related O-acetyltransferase n=1 Tax=Accumulibacter sp. TaxID=2053492 RepID=UPI0025DFD065|nr:CatB-related O-acetyltransferase [Accumulibacter sp.]MDS4048381.1 CatB-related O-acetyltransferase [Accumulibacter sp.]